MPILRDEVLVEFIRSRLYGDKKMFAKKVYEVYKSSSPDVWGDHDVLDKKRFTELFYRIKREDKTADGNFDPKTFDDSLFDESLLSDKLNRKKNKLGIVFQKSIGILSRHFVDHATL